MSTIVERQLRLQAAQPTLKRLAADRKRAPRLKPYLDTIEARLYEVDFDVSAMWREHGVRDRSASGWFSPLGMPPKAYLTDCRLSIAGRLIVNTRLHMHRIATLTGYSSLSVFGVAFKAWSGGRTPEEYRQNPDPDPEPWEAPFDLSQLDDALAGRLTRQEGRALCRRFDHARDGLGELYEQPALSDLIAAADRAQAAADHDAALEKLERAARHPDHGEHGAELDARLALTFHCRGTARTFNGDVDHAYDDLTRARGFYASAGVLAPCFERRRRRLEIQVPCSTDDALISALCPDCRSALLLDVGESLRRHLRHALELVPLDLEWFGVCCDECYRVVWRAISLARHGLMADAWQAWWLWANTDLEDSAAPPSVGRVIAALAEVDSLSWSSQEDRLKLCDLALGDAQVLQRPALLLVTRFWRGNVLRALARFPEARVELRWPEAPEESPWLRALHDRFLGLIEQTTDNCKEALALLGAAAAVYETLDPHIAGLLLTQQATVYVDLHEYETGIRLYRQALPSFDERRSFLPTLAAVPVNLARALAGNGDLEQARAELARCRYDRTECVQVAAVEVFTRACIALLSEQAREASMLFSDAQRRFERLDQPIYAALSATYSVEAYDALGDQPQAVAAASGAIRLFDMAGCPTATLEAATRLQALLAGGATARAVANAVRVLAGRHGGWLPPVE